MSTAPAKDWCFTINNYAEQSYELLVSILKPACNYFIIGKEKGEKEGTPHLQGFAQFKKKVTFKTVKRDFFPRAHIEKRRGGGGCCIGILQERGGLY